MASDYIIFETTITPCDFSLLNTTMWLKAQSKQGRYLTVSSSIA